MKAHVSWIFIGVEDMDRSKRFHTEGFPLGDRAGLLVTITINGHSSKREQA
jgi:hypothetical protein